MVRCDVFEAKLPTCSTDSLHFGTASPFTGTLAPGTWPFPTLNAFGQVQSLDTEALPKFGRGGGGGGKVAKRGFMAVLSHMAQMCAQAPLGCSWVVLFLLAPTGLADAAD